VNGREALPVRLRYCHIGGRLHGLPGQQLDICGATEEAILPDSGVYVTENQEQVDGEGSYVAREPNSRGGVT